MKNLKKLFFTSLCGLVLVSSYVVAQDAVIQEPAPGEPTALNPPEAAPVIAPAENVVNPVNLSVEGIDAGTAVQTEEGAVVEAPGPAIDETPVLVGSINPNEIPSLLFTYWEYNAIQEAKNSRGNIATEESAEQQDFTIEEDNAAKPPPDKRDIKLGGILYKSSKDWTIWLNGQRITPGAIPKEVIDLKVYEQYIEVKWYDRYTKQILPIRLRPHQRFNIDSRIFLPG